MSLASRKADEEFHWSSNCATTLRSLSTSTTEDKILLELQWTEPRQSQKDNWTYWWSHYYYYHLQLKASGSYRSLCTRLLAGPVLQDSHREAALCTSLLTPSYRFLHLKNLENMYRQLGTDAWLHKFSVIQVHGSVRHSKWSRWDFFLVCEDISLLYVCESLNFTWTKVWIKAWATAVTCAKVWQLCETLPCRAIIYSVRFN